MTGIPIGRRQAVPAAGLAAAWLGLPGQARAEPGAAARAAAAASAVLETSDYQGVRLLASRWRAQQDAVLNYYLAVPVGNYLLGFRRRAGRPAPGSELAGWLCMGAKNAASSTTCPDVQASKQSKDVSCAA